MTERSQAAPPVTSIEPGAPIWHDIVEQLPVAAWIGDGNGRMLWGNRRWRDEIAAGTVADYWTDLLQPDEIDAVRAAWQACAVEGQAFAAPVSFATPRGPHRRTVTLRPILSASGTATRWVGVIADDEAELRAESDRAATRAELDTLTNAMPQMVWATRPDGHHDYYNAQWYRFTGMPDGSTDGEGWNGMFHPDDQDRAWTRWRHSLTTGEDYEIEYRLRHHSGVYRWVLGRALPVRGADDAIVRWIGTCTDIDSAKRAAEQNEILSRELSHRIKNIFAVITGLLRMSARQDPAARPFADRLAGRIAALGAAHDLARPHSERSRPTVGDAATLHHILAELLQPYDASQWSITGDDVPIDDRGATPIALVFHELATNAAKYGALSCPQGHVTLGSTRRGDLLILDWCERGGPVVDGAPDTSGFGTKLAALSIEQQLGGTIVRDWQPEGLAVRITIGADALVRR
ncbi:sensor histidine kinase [Sphingomonas silueang]|uniref:sensor histidine kinase n=1 Tax=Sphingomonas silueang TaxID=3156617 RepID=UPI0032B44413